MADVHNRRIIRVFPRRTKATPDDALAYFGPPDLFAEADEVHVSVTFTYDVVIAEQLAEQWRHVAPVKIGGVAYGDASLEFIPNRYIRPGYTITSRGCPRRCWFCGVWKKWPTVNALPRAEPAYRGDFCKTIAKSSKPTSCQEDQDQANAAAEGPRERRTRRQGLSALPPNKLASR